MADNNLETDGIAIDKQDFQAVNRCNVDDRGRLTLGSELEEYWRDKDEIDVAVVNGRIIIINN